MTSKAFSLIAGLFIVGVSLAQSGPARSPHGLVVLDLSLSLVTSPPRPGVSLSDGDTAPGRRDNPQQDPVDKMRGPSAVPSPAPKQPAQNVYAYALKLRNEGEKNVRSVLWEYVAADLNTGAELNRRRFKSIADINHGKTVTLRATSLSPPARVVTTGMLSKDQLSQFRSSVDIKCVLCGDGTPWEAGGRTDCDELRQAEADARTRKKSRSGPEPNLR